MYNLSTLYIGNLLSFQSWQILNHSLCIQVTKLFNSLLSLWLELCIFTCLRLDPWPLYIGLTHLRRRFYVNFTENSKINLTFDIQSVIRVRTLYEMTTRKTCPNLKDFPSILET